MDNLSKVLEMLASPFIRPPGAYGKYDPGSFYGQFASQYEQGETPEEKMQKVRDFAASSSLMFHGGVKAVPGASNLPNVLEALKNRAITPEEAGLYGVSDDVIRAAQGGLNDQGISVWYRRSNGMGGATLEKKGNFGSLEEARNFINNAKKEGASWKLFEIRDNAGKQIERVQPVLNRAGNVVMDKKPTLPVSSKSIISQQVAQGGLYDASGLYDAKGFAEATGLKGKELQTKWFDFQKFVDNYSGPKSEAFESWMRKPNVAQQPLNDIILNILKNKK